MFRPQRAIPAHRLRTQRKSIGSILIQTFALAFFFTIFLRCFVLLPDLPDDKVIVQGTAFVHILPMKITTTSTTTSNSASVINYQPMDSGAASDVGSASSTDSNEGAMDGTKVTNTVVDEIFTTLSPVDLITSYTARKGICSAIISGLTQLVMGNTATFLKAEANIIRLGETANLGIPNKLPLATASAIFANAFEEIVASENQAGSTSKTSGSASTRGIVPIESVSDDIKGLTPITSKTSADVTQFGVEFLLELSRDDFLVMKGKHLIDSTFRRGKNYFLTTSGHYYILLPKAESTLGTEFRKVPSPHIAVDIKNVAQQDYDRSVDSLVESYDQIRQMWRMSKAGADVVIDFERNSTDAALHAGTATDHAHAPVDESSVGNQLAESLSSHPGKQILSSQQLRQFDKKSGVLFSFIDVFFPKPYPYVRHHTNWVDQSLTDFVEAMDSFG